MPYSKLCTILYRGPGHLSHIEDECLSAALMVQVPPETVGVRVCCFPASAIRSVGDRIGISPPLGQHDMSQMLQVRYDINPAGLVSG